MLAPAPMVAPSQLRLVIACDLQRVRPLARAAREFLAKQELPETEVMGCELALVEACNNAVLYAPNESKSLPIEVEIACDDARVEIKILDHTKGFTIEEDAPLPSAECESGRGLFIMRSVMDKLEYIRGNGTNTLRMELNRNKQPNLAAVTSVAPDTSPSIAEFKRKLAESEQIISDMAEELSSCYETLSAIFRCGTEFGKTNSLKDIARSLCNDLLQITDSDWYVLRIVPADDSRLVTYSTSDATIGLEPLPLSQPAVFESAELRAATARHDIWFTATNPLNPGDPLAQIDRGMCGMVHPFSFAETLMGTLTVGKALNKPAYTAAQANVVHTFADFLAIQTVNSRLQEEQVKNRVISRELEIAKTIQVALLPKTLPEPKGFSFAGFCENARQVGGDFYDVVELSPSSYLLIIADVMGKGIPAAMFAAILRSVLRATPEYNQQPAALLSRINRLLYEELSEVEMFITAQLVHVDLAARKMVTASAGHCPVLLASPCESRIRAISPDGIPLGILPDSHFADDAMDLPPNFRLLLYTDGLTEAQNATRQFFGDQRLLNSFLQSANRCETAHELKQSLALELRTFQGDAALYDDQTFLVLAEDNLPRRSHAGEDISGG